ncbi:pyridoxal-dependent decarboxylase [Streptomyces sp. NPDC055036]
MSVDEINGHVTTGRSEGVLYGLLTARRQLPHAYVYASNHAHPSVAQATEVLGMTLVTVAARNDGMMDPELLSAAVSLRRRLTPRFGRGHGAIVLATIGTTRTGAYDDVTLLRRTAAAAGDVYVHADASDGGLIAAHAPSRPRWSFAHGADSLSLSGQSIGVPVPCGAVLVRRSHVPPAAATPGERVEAADRPLGWSRNGLTTLLMWSALRRLGHAGMRANILRCLETADYAHQRLGQTGAEPIRVADTLTLTFRRPAPSVAARWRLACLGNRARFVTDRHVTRSTINCLCEDLVP